MYTPAAFAATDLALLDALVGADPFVTLVTVGADGAPFASHLPVLYRRDGDRVRLEGHWARPNPQARHAGPALAIVHGPHAYVSPGWYPDKEPAARVPTWNYAVAHLAGRCRCSRTGPAHDLSPAPATAPCRRRRPVGRFEPGREAHRRQLRGIVVPTGAHRISSGQINRTTRGQPARGRRRPGAAGCAGSRRLRP